MSYPSLPPAQGQPPPPQAGLANQMAEMSLQPGQGLPRAGDSPLLSMFTHGNVLVLESTATNKSLRIKDGTVEGTGGRGQLAQFTVHVRRPGVVALQNVKNPDYFLAIYEGSTNGVGRGGPYCEFLVGEIEDKYITLESTMYPGQHIGILPDGCVKDPDKTHTGQHARYTPTVISYAGQPSPPTAHAPPPAGYPPPQGPPAAGYPPPQGPPPGQQPSPPTAHVPLPMTNGPPPAGYPPPQAPPPGQQYPPPSYQQATYGAPPPAGYPAPPPAGYAPPPAAAPPAPTGPQLPFGFNVLDAFRDGTVLQLVSRSSGFPIGTRQGAFTTRSTQFGSNDSNLVVVVPRGAAPGIIMLRSAQWPGMHLAVGKGGNFSVTKATKFCHLKPMPLADNYVTFMSVENPGQFIGFRSNGSPSVPKTTTQENQDAQFFIRVEKQLNPGHSQTIMTPFGRPSMANTLRDGCVIQLYLKDNGNYLSINRSGVVQFIKNANDNHTFFRVSDRGMGIYSLNSYNHKGYRLRMVNFVLGGKGTADMSSDFRLKEMPDGTVLFESVTCQGSFVGIQGSQGLHTNLNVFLVMIQRFGGAETVTKTPLN